MPIARDATNLPHVHNPYTLISGDAAVLLTCEHASERLPAPLRWPKADRRLLGTHWAFDLGARELTEELAAALGCGAVLAEFSRLVIDPNRALDEPTLIRTRAEGAPIQLNEALPENARRERIERLYEPYHDAVDRAVRASGAPTLLSVHSFTPVYEGSVRPMEVGVLFDQHEQEAQTLGDALSRAGFAVAYNAPYSGREGLIYSVERHARTHGRVALELEVRQDRSVDPAFRQRLVSALARFFAC